MKLTLFFVFPILMSGQKIWSKAAVFCCDQRQLNNYYWFCVYNTFWFRRLSKCCHYSPQTSILAVRPIPSWTYYVTVDPQLQLRYKDEYVECIINLLDEQNRGVKLFFWLYSQCLSHGVAEYLKQSHPIMISHVQRVCIPSLNPHVAVKRGQLLDLSYYLPLQIYPGSSRSKSL